MARFNEALRFLLTNDNLNNEDGAIAALNAILEAGYHDAAAQRNFRQAVVNHKAFWDHPTTNPPIVITTNPEPNLQDDSFLCLNGAVFQNDVNNDANNDVRNNFASLTSLALAKRAELSLKDADETQLENIINQHLQRPDDGKAFRSLLVNENDGTTKFGSPTLTIPNWGQTRTADFSEQDRLQFEKLRAEAQRQLLLNKINTCNDRAMINNLLTNLNNAPALKAAVRTLFGAKGDLADSIQWGPVINDLVVHAAAKRSISLYLNRLEPQRVPASLRLLNARNRAEFQQALAADLGVEPTIVGSLLLDDKAYIDSVKKDIGVKFLISKAAELKETNIQHMEDVAATENLDDAKATLKKIQDLGGAEVDTYLDLAVTETTLPQIREAYALNALKISISKCSDPATLDDLLKVTNRATLDQALTKQKSLGYTDRPMFRAAFRENPATFKSIVAAAHIRKNITLSTKPELLKNLITAADFKRYYREHFAAGEPEGVKTAINANFDVVENLRAAREQTLLAYVKAKVSEMNDEELTRFLRLDDCDQVRDGIANILGGHQADDLFRKGMQPNDDLAKDLLRYAAVERVTRDAEAEMDLSPATGAANYDNLLRSINEFAFAENAVGNRLNELPKEEKESLRTLLTQSLIRNYPKNRLGPQARDTENKLVRLTKVKDFDEFRRLLGEFGVTNTGWVTKESMEQIQKSAGIRQVQFNFNLNLGSAAHPQLFKLIENLPQEKRLALLDKPEVIRDLAAASDKVEVERILGGTRVVRKELIDGLIKENDRVNLFAKIWNSEIGATLAQIKPPIAITEQQVDAINQRLIDADYPHDQFDNVARKKAKISRYEQNIQIIAKKIMPNPSPELYDAFGLDAAGLVRGRLNPGAVEAQKIKLIQDQQHHNYYFIKNYYYGEVPKTVANLLAFKKTAQFTEAHFKQFNEVFNESESWEDFHTKANGKNFRNVFDPTLTEQLTPQIFEEMKIEVRKKAMEGKKGRLTPKEQEKENELLEKELNIQEEEIKHLDEKFSKIRLDSYTQKSLKRLSEASLMCSFNPAFRASAKKNAEQMAPVIRELSEQCKSYIAYYTNLKRVAKLNAKATKEAHGATDPRHVTKRKALEKANLKWATLHKNIREELELLQRLQTIYMGDPDNANPVIREGLLKSLEDAKAGSRDVHILARGVTTYSVDYDNAERAAHFERGHVAATNPNPKRQQGTGIEANTEDAPVFEMVDAIPNGKFREQSVVVDGEAEQGSYLEERYSKDLEEEVNSANEMDYHSSLRLTANKIPASKEGKVALAMSMAMKAVAALKEPPTEKNPLKVVGDNPEFAKYLWTALMIIGESDPNFKFGKDAIKVTAARVDVDNEKGFFGWSDDSIYNKAFKNSLICKDMLEPIKAINEKRFGVDEELEFEDIVEDTTKLNTFFKPKLEQPEVEKELKEVESNRPTLGSPGSSSNSSN